MKRLRYTEAFSRFGARLKNARWSVCAEAGDGSLVVSVWDHRFDKQSGRVFRYRDDLSRWKSHGNKELREKLRKAYSSGQIIRAIVVKADDIKAVESGSDASLVKKSFTVQENWVGRVVELDEPRFVIDFIAEEH